MLSVPSLERESLDSLPGEEEGEISFHFSEDDVENFRAIVRVVERPSQGSF